MAGFGQMQKCAFSLSLDSCLMNISHLSLKCRHFSVSTDGRMCCEIILYRKGKTRLQLNARLGLGIAGQSVHHHIFPDEIRNVRLGVAYILAKNNGMEIFISRACLLI